MSYTEAQKRAIYNWRSKNVEKCSKDKKVWNKSYYDKNPDFCRSISLKHYYMKKEMTLFRNILLC